MKLFRAIKLILTLRCEESSRLVSEALDRDLSFSERWAVRLHRMVCASCHRLKHQFDLIRQAAGKTADADPPLTHHLSADSRAKILEAVRGNDGERP
ncbi:MAG: zf-HC2 domain-containing protein [Planctomycetota bacterium]